MKYFTPQIYKHLTSTQTIKLWLQLIFGACIMAAGFVIFINPYNIVPGGVYGLGIVMHNLFPSIQVGTFGLMFDIPLLLIALRIFGVGFGSKTIVAALIIPVLMNIMTYIIGEDPATMFGGHADLSNDIIISCIFGGVMIGSGLGFIIKSHATSGGTDILAMLLNKYAKITFSKGILFVDSMVVIFGMIVLGDWRLPLYSIVTIFVATKAIDYIIDGASYDKLLFILSNKNEEIKRFVLEDMGRGGTYIKSSGMYTGADKEMIFLVVSRSEVSLVQSQIHKLDPDSFVVVVNAYETYGDGFKSFADNN